MHTLGPWAATLSDDARVDDRITGADGAPVFRGSITNSPDAALIAAAPDLLAALQACVRAYENCVPADQKWTFGTNLVPGWSRSARAAIARAAGQS